MEKDFSIRPYSSDDAHEIIEWCGDELHYYQWCAGILGPYPLSMERFGQFISERASKKEIHPFTATLDGKAVGFFFLRRIPDLKDLLRVGLVIVSPELRGKGYGKRMLQMGLEMAEAEFGITRFSLGVFRNNASAFRCYKALGFQETSESEEYKIKDLVWEAIEMESIR